MAFKHSAGRSARIPGELTIITTKVYLTPSEKLALKAIAEEDGCSISEWIRGAVLEKHFQKKGMPLGWQYRIGGSRG